MKKLLILLLFPLSLFAQDNPVTYRISLDSIVNKFPGWVQSNFTSCPCPDGIAGCAVFHACPDHSIGMPLSDDGPMWWEENKNLQMVDPDRIKNLEDKVKELEAKIDLLIQLIKKE